MTRMLCYLPLTLAAMVLPGLADGIPFPAALKDAHIVQDRLDDLQKRAFVLGNGDLNALLWDRDGALCLRVAKNDIWDARLDTSQDPPLMKVDVANQTWSGGGYPPSWKKPYPSPRCAAVVRIGGGAAEAGAWRCIRAQGRTNEWVRRGDLGVMVIEGAADASAGYRWTLGREAAAGFTAFTMRLSGTPGARYYVNVLDAAGKAFVKTGWRETPAAEQDVSLSIPSTGAVHGIELYVQTATGARVENRIRRIALEGGRSPLAIPAGMAERKLASARLDLGRAVAEIEETEGGRTAVRALADRNVLLIETAREVSLEDLPSAELPAAELGEQQGVRWLHMRMPGDGDYRGMEYALAVAAAGARKAVSLVTSFDAKGDVRGAAVRLARETADGEPAALIARHEQAWRDYWSASGVELDDPDFQPWWYRMVYYLRCFARPGAEPVGLFGGMPTDSPPWHGDYHHNYNAWQPYWTPFIVNHPELAGPWIDYMNEMLPRLRWFARATYDGEGAFVGISSFAHEPDPDACRSVNRRHCAIPPFGYTLGMIGMSAQNLWYSHLYRPDREYLAAKIYPVLREAALFYASFAERCPRDPQGKAKFGPSYSPEHGAFGVANVPFDLAYARFTLNAAVAAAGELGRDGELAARWRRALDLLPPYPTAPDETGRPVVVDWTGCAFREIKQHNITVPVAPVFPADQVTWFSPEPEKQLFLNTIRQTKHRGCNSTVMFGVAKARLSMPEALEDLRRYYRPEVQPNGMFHWPMHGYYLSESVGIAAMVSECLVQSVGGVIRVFPAWPKERDAKFTNLRAQGGFLVSAEQRGGAIVRLRIVSTVGGRLRLLDPWTGRVDERETKPGEEEERSLVTEQEPARPGGDAERRVEEKEGPAKKANP